jgi:hypothetical protein
MFRALRTAVRDQNAVFGMCYRGGSHTTRSLLQSVRAHRSYHGATSGIYEKLNHAKNEIRVLRIDPGRWDDDISCSLKVISLDGLSRYVRAKYDTLSYTWGDPQSTRTIRVNHQSIDVSTNLFVALRALRRRFMTATIWADALCINQKDDSEKGKQVALMGKIYEQGGQTWVSLGCPDERWADGSWSPAPHVPGKSRMFLRLIRGIWRLVWHHLVLCRSRQSRLGVGHVSDAVRIVRAATFKPALNDPEKLHQTTAASMLAWLARHDYWSRVWIVQEITLSRTDPICLFGGHQIPLLSLDTALSDWSDGNLLALDQRKLDLTVEDGKGMDRAQEICMLRDEYYSRLRIRHRGSMELSRALQLASFRRASVAHDHVYGLRSLVSTKDQEALQPDYNLTTRELYASVTRLLLRQRKSIDLLCAAVGTGQYNQHNVPSWSLDFSRPLRLPAKRADDNVSGDHSITSGGDNLLRVQGRNLKQQIIASIPRHYTDDFNASPTLSAFLSREIYEEDSYRRGLNRYSASAETSERQRPNSNCDESPDGPAHSAEVASQPSSNVRQRYVLFETDQENYGKCLNDVLLGDEIWSFVGSDTLFVVRPLTGHDLGNRYQLIGPCLFLAEVNILDTVPQSIELV